MSLIVVSRLKLDTLQKITVRDFHEVENKNIP